MERIKMVNLDDKETSEITEMLKEIVPAETHEYYEMMSASFHSAVYYENDFSEASVKPLKLFMENTAEKLLGFTPEEVEEKVSNVFDKVFAEWDKEVTESLRISRPAEKMDNSVTFSRERLMDEIVFENEYNIETANSMKFGKADLIAMPDNCVFKSADAIFNAARETYQEIQNNPNLDERVYDTIRHASEEVMRALYPDLSKVPYDLYKMINEMTSESHRESAKDTMQVRQQARMEKEEQFAKNPAVENLPQNLEAVSLPENCDVLVKGSFSNKGRQLLQADNHFYLKEADKISEAVLVDQPYETKMQLAYTTDGLHVNQADVDLNSGAIHIQPMPLKEEQLKDGMSCTLTLDNSPLTVVYHEDKLSLLYEGHERVMPVEENENISYQLSHEKIQAKGGAKELFIQLDAIAETSHHEEFSAKAFMFEHLPKLFDELSSLQTELQDAFRKDSIQEVFIDAESEVSSPVAVSVVLKIDDDTLEYLAHEKGLFKDNESLQNTNAVLEVDAVIYPDDTVNAYIIKTDKEKNLVQLNISEQMAEGIIAETDAVFEKAGKSLKQELEDIEYDL